MITPRSEHYSCITRCVRHDDGTASISRWYAGPRWTTVTRTYRVRNPRRLDVIYAGLRRWAH